MIITEQLIQQARRNISQDPWVADAAAQIVKRAAPCLEKSDEELWNLMFAPTLRRCWSVYANGFCPSCKVPVPMYTWKMDSAKHPWKAICPHCEETFPKNDFGAFYRSGLDAHAVFDPKQADRSLLFNVEHPDPQDPVHLFGVDDGEGYVAGEHRWYFIATYLIYGLWYPQILAPINALAAAYVVTGDPVYARKTAILLDRVADFYPLFDFQKQAGRHAGGVAGNGYVTTWHNACYDTLGMATAYDMIRSALPGDTALVEFLSGQARRYQLANPKTQWADIQRNIEERILRDALRNPVKIVCNYPQTEIAKGLIYAALGEPDGEAVAQIRLDEIIELATRVDGITGEKGLAAYSAFTISALAGYLATLARRDPKFLPTLLARHPVLLKTYRFHIDTWCLQKYYPNIGDGMEFGETYADGQQSYYAGMSLTKTPALGASLFSFLMALYRATGDVAYVQVLYHTNGRSTENLPYDLFVEDAAAFRQEVQQVIAAEGPVIKLKSVNKEQWCLGILRSGEGNDARALWLDYDLGGGHAHSDGLNLGLFAKGLDLLPDCGYPQVQYGGSEDLKAGWFCVTASHNTVLVDGKDQGHRYKPLARGKTTLWADGTALHGMRVRFDAEPAPLPRVYHRTYGHVALYTYGTGRFGKVRISTRLNSTDPWQLQFTDDFQRTELGADWKVLSGDWRIENGQLVGTGTILCARNLPGMQRLEYEAMANDDAPCDLSAYLACDTNGTGVFCGFGSNRNRESKIIVDNVPAGKSATVIVPGQRHQISCICEAGRVELIVDGVSSVVVDSVPNPCLDLVFGDVKGPRQYERTIGLLDLSPKDFYVFDIFRVVGGCDHARLFHSYFGTVKTEGLTLTPGEEYGHNTLLQNFQTDAQAKPGWQVDWTIEDKLKLAAPGAHIHLRHTDLTTAAEATIAESWVNVGNFNAKNEVWIPTIITRHRGAAPVATTFIEMIEPYEGRSNIKATRRLPLQTPEGTAYGDNYVAIEVELVDGRRDLIICADVDDVLSRTPSLSKSKMMIQPAWGVKTDGELAVVRRDASGKTIYTALCRGRILEAGELTIKSETFVDYFEQGMKG